MKTKDYKGITLIALIITIIVLLILAGVSISLVVGDNGVLGQAVNATTATDIAETKEAIELAVIGYLDENGEYTVSDVEQAVSDAGATLGSDGVTVTTAKGNTFDISDLIDGAIVRWSYDDDGNVTNGSVTLAIGDTVYYNAVTGATETSYTSYSIENGYSDQTFTLEDEDTDYEWQVMGADEETGELLIVLSYSTVGSNLIKTSNGHFYYLKGQDGYANCVDELDNICSLFGQGYGATGARSITVEDVNKLAGYDPTDIDGEGNPYGIDSIKEYGNKVTYTKNSSTGYIDYQGTIYPADLTTQTKYSSFTYYAGTGWITLGSGESVTLKSICYSWYKSDYSENSDVVFPSYDYYWLASPTTVLRKWSCAI